MELARAEAELARAVAEAELARAVAEAELGAGAELARTRHRCWRRSARRGGERGAAVGERGSGVFRAVAELSRARHRCWRRSARRGGERGSGVLRAGAELVTEPTNYTKLSKKIIHQSRRLSKLKSV